MKNNSFFARMMKAHQENKLAKELCKLSREDWRSFKSAMAIAERMRLSK